jgi:hypothetical protein
MAVILVTVVVLVSVIVNGPVMICGRWGRIAPPPERQEAQEDDRGEADPQIPHVQSLLVNLESRSENRILAINMQKQTL